METIKKSACPLNCWDNCGFRVTIENGKVKNVDGDLDHPITQGKICSRGRMLSQRVNAEARLKVPLKKINGNFLPITWNQALDEIAEKMAKIKAEVGSTAVLHSHDYANNGILKNLDQRFFHCYGGVTELTGSLCWGAGIEAQKWDFGNAASHAPNDLMKSKNIVVWGRNVARTNLHLYEKLLLAKKQGAKLVVIDPIYNATAKIAHQHISIAPGMDGFLALGIIKEIVRLGLADREFIETATVGYSDLEKLISEIDIDTITKMTDVSGATITQLAQMYTDGPTATSIGLGMQRYYNGGNTIRLIDALVAISGNIGIAGGGANYANLPVGQSFEFSELTLPNRKEEHREFSIMTQAEEILSAKDPEIRMIFVSCGNPLTQLPDTSTVIKAFNSVETVVVLDSYLTDSAKLADYVLPVAMSFEEEDLYYSSMYHHYVNYGPKLVEPPGEAKPDLWILTQLAQRLGFGDDFAYSREQWLKLCLEPLEKQGITLEALKENHWAELPVEEVPWSDRKFQTPSGKFEFTSSVGGRKLTLSLPRESKWSNQALSEMYPYQLLTIHPLRSNHSQHYPLWHKPPELKVEIAVNIAEKHNLKDGDLVRVWNQRGEVTGTVVVRPQHHSNTINIDEGISAAFGGSVNKLTSSLRSDNGLGSTLYDCLVTIEKKSCDRYIHSSF